MKHTKGEWTIRKEGKKKWEREFSIWSTDKCSTCNHSIDIRIIGNIRESAVGLEEAEANAKLIAAAPELLEALNDLLNRYISLVESGDAGYWDPDIEEEVIKSRLAIQKATE